MNIGIVGMGNVGGALAKALKRGHDIFGYDKYIKKFSNITPITKCSVIFLTVPTPMKLSGEIDLHSIYDSINALISAGLKRKTLIVLKSTAVSGTTDRLAKDFHALNFAFVPEFLREKTAEQDMLHAKRIVIGAETKAVHELIKTIFIDAKYGKNCTYVLVNRKTAEAIKYASNVYLANKITFANELYNICEKLDVNYNIVVDAICLDKRINRQYGWDVPGDNNKRGFGGRCFPKDLKALIYLAKERGYSPYLLEEIWRSNLNFRGEQDWLEIDGVKGERR